MGYLGQYDRSLNNSFNAVPKSLVLEIWAEGGPTVFEYDARTDVVDGYTRVTDPSTGVTTFYVTVINYSSGSAYAPIAIRMPPGGGIPLYRTRQGIFFSPTPGTATTVWRKVPEYLNAVSKLKNQPKGDIESIPDNIKKLFEEFKKDSKTTPPVVVVPPAQQSPRPKQSWATILRSTARWLSAPRRRQPQWSETVTGSGCARSPPAQSPPRHGQAPARHWLRAP